MISSCTLIFSSSLQAHFKIQTLEDIELWSNTRNKSTKYTNQESKHVELKTLSLVSTVRIPFWTISGNPLRVYSSNKDTCLFFNKMSTLGYHDNGVSKSGLLTEKYLFYVENKKKENLNKFGVYCVEINTQIQVTGEVKSSIPKLMDDNINTNKRLEVEEYPVSGKGTETMLQHVVLAGLRIHGITRKHPEYKSIYHNTYKSSVFALRKKTNPKVDEIQDVVDKLLNVFM